MYTSKIIKRNISTDSKRDILEEDKMGPALKDANNIYY